MRVLAAILKGLPLLILSIPLLLVALLVFAATDLFWLLFGKKRIGPDTRPSRQAATVVIPNWNGRDLLEKYLSSVVKAIEANPRNEVIVVDDASTDGSAAFVRQRFPDVRVLELEKKHGFGGGSNAGIRAANNDIVVMLNNDMRVMPDFLKPLLDGFTDEKVFAVSCQIFFSDPARKREETGQTQAWWANGALRVRHRADPAVGGLFPCFYGGGGSCAFDRRKLLELGGFDSLLKPFYLEDTDLGYMAWKRGWKVMYQPASVVYHEHRGTIGKRFSTRYIDSVLKKNYLLFAWKNIHEWGKLLEQLAFAFSSSAVSLVAGESPERSNYPAILRACLALPLAVRSRWRARSLAAVSDTEAFRRPLGGYFRDRFEPDRSTPERLKVLFFAPYPIVPPVHGGAVFMSQTVEELARRCDLHLVILLDEPSQAAAHQPLAGLAKSVELFIRPSGVPKAIGSLVPHAVREFQNHDVEWLLHRVLYNESIDVLQVEYTSLAQYGGPFDRLVTALFEHDVYFQSVGRQWKTTRALLSRARVCFEYLRALRFELTALPSFDQVQVCSPENREYLASFLPGMEGRIQSGLRAGIDTASYPYQPAARVPDTLLFLGSFRHQPNLAAMEWFMRRVYPLVVSRRASVRLVLAGSEPPPNYQLPPSPGPIEFLGQVADVRDVFTRYAVFVCPVLSGSGVRVKLLEAFACGMPAVSTTLGAEGLTSVSGEICELADTPELFAAAVLRLLEDPAAAAEMAARARRMAERFRDTRRMTEKLVESYRRLLEQKRGAAPATASAVASNATSVL